MFNQLAVSENLKSGQDLIFQPLKLEHIPLFRHCLEKWPYRTCDGTIGAIFMWRDYFATEFASADGMLYLKTHYLDHETAFAPPLGPDRRRGYEQIAGYCAANRQTIRFCSVPVQELVFLKDLFGENHLDMHAERDWSDYLYNSSDMVNFAGRKYSGQRNNMHKFEKACPDWRFERIEASHLAEVRRFFLDFEERYAKNSNLAQEEASKVLEVFDHYQDYQMLGGILKTNDQIIGISMGEIIGDTLYVHIEKAVRDYPGSYQMLVNQFAKEFVTEQVHFVNREEDVGDEGLRASKLSYHPVELLEKYTVEII